MLENESCRRLAVRPGHPDHVQRAVRAAVKARRHRRHGAARVIHLDERRSGPVELRIFQHHGGRAPAANVRDEAMPIGLHTAPREKDIVGLDAPRIITQRMNRPVDGPAHRLDPRIVEKIGELHGAAESGLCWTSASAAGQSAGPA